jgi:hypothetical protein
MGISRDPLLFSGGKWNWPVSGPLYIFLTVGKSELKNLEN